MKKPIAAAIAVAAIPLLMLTLIAGVVIAADENQRRSGGGAAAGGIGGGLKEGVGGKWRPWILKAGALCPKVTPAVLAAQLEEESGFDDTAKGPVLPDGSRALGIAQFLPSTFATYAKDDDGNGQASIWDGGDAIMAQGRMMCELVKDAEKSGYAGGTIQLALAGYNAGWGWVDYYKGIPPFGQTTGYVADIMKRSAEWTVAITGGGGGGMGPIPGGLNIPGGPQPFQGGAAGVCGEPDPTGGRCLTKATAHGYAEIMKQWPEKSWGYLGCQADRNDGGEHPLGRACDIGPGQIGVRPNESQLAQGWALAAWLRAHAQELDVHYVIWQGRIWSVKRPADVDGGWGRPYVGGINDPTDITGGHYDHVHVTFLD